MRKKGFTLIELLIVISIVIILLAFSLINIRGQIAKANDAKRKSDVYTLRNALEEYNNDHNAFPPQGTIDNCGSAFAPYLAQIPCDPTTRSPYGYFLYDTGSYRVCAIIANTADPALAAMGCGDARWGCGIGGGYNYCLASGTTPSAVGLADQPTSTPTTPGGGTTTPGGGTQTPHQVACTKGGDCNSFSGDISGICPTWWTNSCPAGACGNPANLCSQ